MTNDNDDTPPDTSRRQPRTNNHGNSPNNTTQASKVLRVVETLHGKDDIGVEEFIKTCKFARSKCTELDMLLRMIITEKITDQAKRSIRFCWIHTFEELYVALRNQIFVPTAVSGSRNRLHNIKQGMTESVQFYSSRFRQALSELEYAIQAKHRNPTALTLHSTKKTLKHCVCIQSTCDAT